MQTMTMSATNRLACDSALVPGGLVEVADSSTTGIASPGNMTSMSDVIDVAAARAFLTKHGRMLDRRRLDAHIGEGDPAAILAALEAYRNPDGGYGWGLEPDLRAGESQPAGALHALEAMADAAPVTSSRAVELCDWLTSVSLPDGGLPFALPIADSTGCAPFWAGADPSVSSLQITAVVAMHAHRVAASDPNVARHPWLTQATDYCARAIRKLDAAPHAIELAFAVRFVDAAYAALADGAELLDRLGGFIPADGVVPVAGGLPDEAMRVLDFAPVPGPARRLFAAGVVADGLRDLAAEQQSDGGWTVDFASYSAAASLEWRGYATVRAVAILQE